MIQTNKVNSSYDMLSAICHQYLSNYFEASTVKSEVQVPEDFDWSGFLLLARRHGVRHIVLAASEYCDIPDDIRERLQGQCRDIIIKNMSLYRECLKIMEFLDSRNISYVPLKGPFLALRVFGDLGMREMSDIDILIDESDLDELKEYLLARDYQAEVKISEKWMDWYKYNNCEYNFDLYKDGNRIYHVEPHWFLGPRVLQTHISLDDLTVFRDNQSDELSPELLMITVCVHHGNDMCRKLKHLVDVYSILAKYEDEFDWDRLFLIAKSLDVYNLILYCIAQVHIEFNLAIPDFVKQVIKHEISDSLNLAGRRVRSDGLLKPGSLRHHYKRFRFQLSLREKVSTKLRILFNILVFYGLFRLFIFKDR